MAVRVEGYHCDDGRVGDVEEGLRSASKDVLRTLSSWVRTSFPSSLPPLGRKKACAHLPPSRRETPPTLGEGGREGGMGGVSPPSLREEEGARTREGGGVRTSLREGGAMMCALMHCA